MRIIILKTFNMMDNILDRCFTESTNPRGHFLSRPSIKTEHNINPSFMQRCWELEERNPGACSTGL